MKYPMNKRVCVKPTTSHLFGYCKSPYLALGDNSRSKYQCIKCKSKFSYNKQGKSFHNYYLVRLIQLYLEGVPIKTLARILNTTNKTILDWLGRLSHFTPVTTGLRLHKPNPPLFNKLGTTKFDPSFSYKIFFDDTQIKICLNRKFETLDTLLIKKWYPKKDQLPASNFSFYLEYLKKVRTTQLFLEGVNHKAIQQLLNLRPSDYKTIIQTKFSDFLRLNYSKNYFSTKSEYGEFIIPIISHGKSEESKINHNLEEFDIHLKIEYADITYSIKNKQYLSIEKLG